MDVFVEVYPTVQAPPLRELYMDCASVTAMRAFCAHDYLSSLSSVLSELSGEQHPAPKAGDMFAYSLAGWREMNS